MDLLAILTGECVRDGVGRRPCHTTTGIVPLTPANAPLAFQLWQAHVQPLLLPTPVTTFRFKYHDNNNKRGAEEPVLTLFEALTMLHLLPASASLPRIAAFRDEMSNVLVRFFASNEPNIAQVLNSPMLSRFAEAVVGGSIYNTDNSAEANQHTNDAE